MAATRSSVLDWYPHLIKPPGTPPGWVFGVVWSLIYGLMGVAGWLVWRCIGTGPALRPWGWQLLLNAAWSPAFFGLRSPSVGLLVILLLMIMVLQTIRTFSWLSRPATWLFVPYLAWIGYATYLNMGIVLLNHR